MASSRLICLLRPASYSDVLVMQSVGTWNKRMISSAAVCWPHNSSRRNCVTGFRGGNLPISPFLSKNHRLGAISQFYRYNAINPKEYKSSDLKSVSSQSDLPKSGSPKLDSPQSKPAEEADELEQFQKLSLYQRLKAMYRDYWYVLVPVHVSTSIVFYGCFYYAASSGIDIIAILESLHFSESVISILRDSSAGYFAVAYALYKIFTPVRYTVTLGGTTWAIRFLKGRGLIKPRRPLKEAKEKMQEKLSAMKMKREKEKER